MHAVVSFHAYSDRLNVVKVVTLKRLNKEPLSLDMHVRLGSVGRLIPLPEMLRHPDTEPCLSSQVMVPLIN